MLNLQPWHVASWRPVTLALTQRKSMIRRLAPCRRDSAQGRRLEAGARGQVMWACDTPEGPAGLAWDWFALRARVPVMADPMGIVSNVGFVDADGVPLSEARRIVELNNIVAALSWQAPIVHAHEHEHEVERVLMAA